MKIDAALSPSDIDILPQRDLAATTAIVFDILRATSTIVTAMANGATQIFPVASYPEALELKRLIPRALLAGERRGVRFDGFDLGNSPLDYRRLGPEPIISLTSNCTAAFRAVARAERVLAGSLLNMGALVAHIKEAAPENLLVVCAGTVREPALEDLFGAGMFCSHFQEAVTSDSVKIAASVFRKYQEDPMHCLHDSSRGRSLMEDGQREDIRWCAHRSLYSVLVEARNGVVSAF